MMFANTYRYCQSGKLRSCCAGQSCRREVSAHTVYLSYSVPSPWRHSPYYSKRQKAFSAYSTINYIVSVNYLVFTLGVAQGLKWKWSATPWIVAYQDPPSMGFSRPEYWSGLPFPSPMHESEKWKVKLKSFSRVWLLATPWTVAYQDPLSLEFSRQEYWSGLPFASAGDLPDPGIEPRCPALQVDSLPSEPPG